MIAPKISIEAQLQDRTQKALRGIDNSTKAALRNGDTERVAEYEKMRDYASKGQFFDAAYVASRLGEIQRSRDFKGLLQFSYIVRGSVPRGPPE